MKHIFFIDPLEKLNIKKDSTLMLALTSLQRGIDAYLLFEKDFYISNDGPQTLKAYKFTGSFKEDGHYLESITTVDDLFLTIDHSCTIHMRIDPPYDSRYQRYLWMLDFLSEKTSCSVLNNPLKIMKYNEKLIAYKNIDIGHLSFVGSSLEGFKKFLQKLEKNYDSIILKPLDLYSGIGVEKVAIKDKNIFDIFLKKVEEFKGAIVCQPFIKEIYNGEYRSIYFDGVELGTIIKKPNKGEFLANIAQGAQFERADLPSELKNICDNIAQDLYRDDVRFLAFDLLGGKVNEVNITCPGLLVEVSYAYNENLCNRIIDQF